MWHTCTGPRKAALVVGVGRVLFVRYIILFRLPASSLTQSILLSTSSSLWGISQAVELISLDSPSTVVVLHVYRGTDLLYYYALHHDIVTSLMLVISLLLIT